MRVRLLLIYCIEIMSLKTVKTQTSPQKALQQNELQLKFISNKPDTSPYISSLESEICNNKIDRMINR